MKIIHLSDLHLGKRVNEFSMMQEQENAIEQIIKITRDEKPDAVIIAGDVYDKSQPSAEAVRLFDRLICGLSDICAHVFVISGNHDSAERIAFGGRIMERGGVHLSPVYDGKTEPHTLRDEYGEVDFFMLPFIKPSHVRAVFEDPDISSYTDAVRCAVEAMRVRPDHRSVLITHQFVTGAGTCDSEEISVGGSDNVDASVFEPFDYVALGHIHGPQHIGRETIRYCGTPLKYSFSEENHKKSVTIVELKEKGDARISTVPIVPIHDMRSIKGKYDELMSREFYEGTRKDDYLRVTLTDERDIPNAVSRLRTVYPNIMRLDYDNSRSRAGAAELKAAEAELRTPAELFAELFKKQNNKEMTDEQKEILGGMIEKIWEGER